MAATAKAETPFCSRKVATSNIPCPYASAFITAISLQSGGSAAFMTFTLCSSALRSSSIYALSVLELGSSRFGLKTLHSAIKASPAATDTVHTAR